MVLRDTAWFATKLGDRFGRKGSADVTLIDCNRTHVWKPKLHEIAAGSMDLSAHEVDYLAQSHWHCFRYRIGEMIGLDRTRREVHVAPSLDDEGREVTPQRAFGYDTLVIAVGSQSNDSGTPGVGEHSMKLESLADARRFHARMVNACIRAHAQATPLRPEQLKVAIIGAGATGVELAAELHRTALVVRQTLQTTRDEHIFALGDCAACAWPDANEGQGGLVPPRAQAAHQQATHIFGQIKRRLAERPLRDYRYRDFGSLVSLGEFSTVGNMMGGLAGGSLMVEGRFARMMYLSLYKMHELALHGFAKVSLDTLARLIVRRTEPHVKLH
jgi:NADH dehydrogenase FAD-containing subunit